MRNQINVVYLYNKQGGNMYSLYLNNDWINEGSLEDMESEKRYLLQWYEDVEITIIKQYIIK